MPVHDSMLIPKSQALKPLTPTIPNPKTLSPSPKSDMMLRFEGWEGCGRSVDFEGSGYWRLFLKLLPWIAGAGCGFVL